MKYLFILFLGIWAPVSGIEYEVLKPPPGRIHIWCIQSPFDSEVMHSLVLGPGGSGFRITMISGEEGYLMRYYDIEVKEHKQIEDFPVVREFNRVLKSQTKLKQGNKEIIVEKNSSLAKEILEAFYIWKSNLREELDKDAVEYFVLEPLMAEPVAGGDRPR